MDVKHTSLASILCHAAAVVRHLFHLQKHLFIFLMVDVCQSIGALQSLFSRFMFLTLPITISIQHFQYQVPHIYSLICYFWNVLAQLYNRPLYLCTSFLFRRLAISYLVLATFYYYKLFHQYTKYIFFSTAIQFYSISGHFILQSVRLVLTFCHARLLWHPKSKCFLCRLFCIFSFNYFCLIFSLNSLGRENFTFSPHCYILISMHQCRLMLAYHSLVGQGTFYHRWYFRLIVYLYHVLL